MRPLIVYVINVCVSVSVSVPVPVPVPVSVFVCGVVWAESGAGHVALTRPERDLSLDPHEAY